MSENGSESDPVAGANKALKESKAAAGSDKAPKSFRFAPLGHDHRQQVIHDEKYTDGSADELTFVHIGKCGGYTIADALEESTLIWQQFKRVKRVHIRPVFYQKEARYLLVLRNPIDRLASAFAWRYQKVVVDKEHEFQFSGECEVLKKYENLNTLAESLFGDGEISVRTLRDLCLITHFQQDIAFYLDGLLPHIRDEQIYAVFTQNTLDADLETVLGVKSVKRQNSNQESNLEKSVVLSDRARKNLRVVFARDYECIKALNKIHPIGQKRMRELLA